MQRLVAIILNIVSIISSFQFLFEVLLGGGLLGDEFIAKSNIIIFTEEMATIICNSLGIAGAIFCNHNFLGVAMIVSFVVLPYYAKFGVFILMHHCS